MSYLAVTKDAHNRETIHILRTIKDYFLYSITEEDVELYSYSNAKFFQMHYKWFPREIGVSSVEQP